MKNILPTTMHPRLFVLIATAFILSTVVGTLTHEAAHYYTAKHYGYEPVLHYGSVSYGTAKLDNIKVFDSLYQADKSKIHSKEYSPEKEAFLNYRANLSEAVKHNRFYFRFAGPLQTTLTGTIGLLFLCYRHKLIKKRTYLKVIEWIFVLLAFFWSRQLANCLIYIYNFITCKKTSGGDEVYIARYLNVSPWVIHLTGAVIASLILGWVVFKIVPLSQRFTFIIAGITGSALGWIIWMETIGPVILP